MLAFHLERVDSDAMNSLTTKKRKKLIRKVSLVFFEDNANGEWGLTHRETLNEQNGTDGFNAFWSGQGIFHDVFEHAHEHTDKHFRGPFSMNYGGEIAAMGALWFYYNECGMSNRLNEMYRAADEITLCSTCDDMEDSVRHGNCRFGDTLESNVPTQKESGNSSLEWIIEEHFNRIQKLSFIKDEHTSEEEENIAKSYKDSVTLEKLANLYRYGYRMAEKLIGSEVSWNGDVMSAFKIFWDGFCILHNAEDLASRFHGVDFSLYRNEENILEWTARFTKHPGDYAFEPLTIKGGHNREPQVFGLI